MGQTHQPWAQFDLVIDRADKCIHLCEIKYSRGAFEITKTYAHDLDRKLEVFRARTATSKTIFLTFTTAFGLKQNAYSTGRVHAEILLEQLLR